MSDQYYQVRVERYKELFKNCKNITDFRKKHPREMYFIRRMNLQSRVFGESRKTKNYWQDFNRCLNAALNCRTRAMFQSSYSGAHKAAVTNGWLNRIFMRHHNQGYNVRHKTVAYFTDQELLALTQKYSTIKDFCIQHKSHYQHIRKYRRDKANYFFGHMTPLGHKYRRSVYTISVGNAVYVGLSADPKRRFRQHKRSMNAVGNIIRLGAKLEIVKSLLSNFEAIELESKLVKEYKEKGFDILNIAKTGSLGAPSTMIPDSDLYEAAKMCETRGEMSRKFQSFYRLATQRKLLDDLFKDHPNKGYIQEHKWSYEKILSVLTDDMNITDLQKIYPGAAAYIRRNDLEERIKIDRPNYFAKKKLSNNTLTFELFKIVAQTMTKTEFCRTHRSLANKAYAEGWMQQVTFMQNDA